MANEIVNYPGSSWPDVVAAAEGYKNGIPESRLSQEVQIKLNADKKPVGGWTEADFSTSVQKLLHLAGGFADNDESASTGTRNVNIDGYMLTAGALVSVRFANAVPAGASLRISPDGGSTYTTRKNIWYDGAPLPADTIKAGMTVSFRYDGSYYQVVAMIPAVAEITVDPTLTQPGEAADAAATGAAIDRVFYQSAKMKLLQLLRGMPMWIIDNAAELIAELEAELFPEGDVESIDAVYTQGAVVYADTPLDELRADLVVTATMSDQSARVITDYTLTGTLAAGTSTVTVHYRDLVDTFSVTVSAAANTGYTSIGTPSISNNVLTPGSAGAVRSPVVFSPGNDPWKIRVGFTTGSAVNTTQDLLGTSDASGTSVRSFMLENVWFSSENRAAMSVYAASDASASSWNIIYATVSAQMQPSTHYLMEVEFTGTAYRARASSDNGSTWSNWSEQASIAKIAGGYYLTLGIKRGGAYFGGTINLAETMVWINNVPWWAPGA
jgi:hypothetical protein